MVDAREDDVVDDPFRQADGARPPPGALPHGAIVLVQRDGAAPLLVRRAGEPEAEPRGRGGLAENLRLEHPPLRRRDLVGELEQDVGARLPLVAGLAAQVGEYDARRPGAPVVLLAPGGLVLHRLAQGPDVRPRQEQAVGQVPPGAGDTQGARGHARIDDQDGVGADAAQVAHVPQDAGRGLPGRVEHNDRRRLERGRRGRAHIGHPQRPALGPQIGRGLLKIGQERALGEEVDAVPGDEDDLGVLVLKVADPGGHGRIVAGARGAHVGAQHGRRDDDRNLPGAAQRRRILRIAQTRHRLPEGRRIRNESDDGVGRVPVNGI